MHHPVIGQLIDCLHQREFVNKTSICSIICVILSKYNAVMSYYEVIICYYEVIMGYSGLLWVIMRFCRTAFTALDPPPLLESPFLAENPAMGMGMAWSTL